MNAEEEKERRDGDECGIILSSSYSFLSERCASPKAALCLSFVGEEKEFFCFFAFVVWGVLLGFVGCKISVLDPPDGRFSRFFLFFFERSA